MLELLNGLTDDQKAVLGCAVALGICGATMCVSYYLGGGTHGTRHKGSAETQPSSSAALCAGRTPTVQASHRKAA